MIKHVHIADLISLINVAFGFLAIFVLFVDDTWAGQIRIHLAFSLILLALLADGLDGIVARRTKSGVLGDYIESMADMTSMGLAPLVFIFSVYQQQITETLFLLIGNLALLLFYLFCCVVRLASFHLMKQDMYFIGLPASASTIILLIVSYTQVPLMITLGCVSVISLLLVSSIRFPRPDKKMNGIATILIFGAIVFGNMFSYFFVYLLLVGIVLYTVAGSLSISLRKR
jgi:CDP-diacylglycerol--serine O-phosphatidyltransferase